MTTTTVTTTVTRVAPTWLGQTLLYWKYLGQLVWQLGYVLQLAGLATQLATVTALTIRVLGAALTRR